MDKRVFLLYFAAKSKNIKLPSSCMCFTKCIISLRIHKWQLLLPFRNDNWPWQTHCNDNTDCLWLEISCYMHYRHTWVHLLWNVTKSFIRDYVSFGSKKAAIYCHPAMLSNIICLSYLIVTKEHCLVYFL